MDIVSRLGYSIDSPFKKAKQLVINSNNITMKDTPFPLIGIPNNPKDSAKVMIPGWDYNFPNSTQVLEKRIYQDGGQPGQAQQDPVQVLLSKEKELIDAHISKLNEQDRKKFLETYRYMDSNDKVQVLSQIMSKMQSSVPNQEDMVNSAFKRFQDGGSANVPPVEPLKLMPVISDGRRQEPGSKFSLYNQSDNMPDNKAQVEAANSALKVASEVKGEQYGIMAIQAHLDKNGYSLPKSKKKSGGFDGIIGTETKRGIEEFINDRTGYLVTKGMDKKEAATEAWKNLVEGTGITTDTLTKYVTNVPKPKIREVDNAAKYTHTLPEILIKSKVLEKPAKEYTVEEISYLKEMEKKYPDSEEVKKALDYVRSSKEYKQKHLDNQVLGLKYDIEKNRQKKMSNFKNSDLTIPDRYGALARTNDNLFERRIINDKAVKESEISKEKSTQEYMKKFSSRYIQKAENIVYDPKTDRLLERDSKGNYYPIAKNNRLYKVLNIK